MKINKIAMFTDIHFGRNSNSALHNTDCLNHVKWFCSNVRKIGDIDAIWFLGDWHEHRSAINGMTLDFSYQAADLLNELGIPIYFCVGNHDLYYRNTRDIYTTVVFNNFENFHIVDEPIVLCDGKIVITPYLFEHEYDAFFEKYNDVEVVAGHFEFKNFVVTGESRVMEHGPDGGKYSKPKKIFSGHFHKRQNQGNIWYIGSAFPMNFSDVNDTERGMAIYNIKKDHLEFIDWTDCPTYIKVNLTDVLDDMSIIKHSAKVKILVDTDLTFDESSKLKDMLVSKFVLRDLELEEQLVITTQLSDAEIEVNKLNLSTTKEVIIEHLKRLKSDKMDNDSLIRIFTSL